jgi:hypothetical protein
MEEENNLKGLEEKIHNLEELISTITERLNTQSALPQSLPIQEETQVNYEVPKNKELPDGLKKYLELNSEIVRVFEEDLEIKDDIIDLVDNNLNKDNVISNFFERNKNSVKKNKKTVQYIKFKIRSIKKQHKFSLNRVYNQNERKYKSGNPTETEKRKKDGKFKKNLE